MPHQIHKIIVAIAVVTVFTDCSWQEKKKVVSFVRSHDTIQYYLDQNLSEIVIQTCNQNILPSYNTTCQNRPDIVPIRISKKKFKNHILAAVTIPSDLLDPWIQQLIRRAIKGEIKSDRSIIFLNYAVLQNAAILRYLVNTQIDSRYYLNIKNYIDKIDSITNKLNISALIQSSIELNKLSANIVDFTFDHPHLGLVSLDRENSSFLFNILYSYINSSKFSAIFNKIPKGIFRMGALSTSSKKYASEIQHIVRFKHDFWIQTTTVTQLQWFTFLGYNPSFFRYKQYCPESYLEINGVSLCADNPVEFVSWEDVQLFIFKLNTADSSFYYRLPTEAEWEYAALDINQTSEINTLSRYSWFNLNANEQTHQVGLKQSNKYGLYDMLGNVWQWVQDWHASYNPNYQTDPTGPINGTNRVYRGGSWIRTKLEPLPEPAYRAFNKPDARLNDVGFRLIRIEKSVLSQSLNDLSSDSR